MTKQETETKTSTSSSNTSQNGAPKSPDAPFAPFLAAQQQFAGMWTDATERFSQLVHAQQNLASMWTEAAGMTEQLVSMQQQMASMWTSAATQAEQFGAQLATFEKDATAKAKTAVGDWSKLAQDAIGYGAQMTAEARKLGLETAKKMAAR